MSEIPNWSNTRLFLFLLLTVLPACGPGNPLGRRAIDGRITLDGSSLESGHIQFIPEESGGVSSGTVIVQGGYYKLETLKGLPPGKYYVQIFSPQDAPATGGNAAQQNTPTGALKFGVELLPAKYNTATTLVVEVSGSGPTTFDFDLTKKP